MTFEFSLSEPPTRHLFMRRESDDPKLTWETAPERWQLFFFCLKGTLRTGPRIYELRHGSVVIVPPRTRSELEVDTSMPHPHYHMNFTPVDSAKDVFAFDQHTDLSSDFQHWQKLFHHALDMLEYSGTPANALIWQLLWTIAVHPTRTPRNPYLIRAEELMRAEMANGYKIRDIAEALYLSPNRLTNVFREETGKTPIQFYRELRAEEAYRLLTSTTLPIKRVAAKIGMPNLHQFNRFCREMLGAAPRPIRNDREIMQPFSR
ncbi:MAG: helix-turn-helix transcriptional regulator [Fimbriimonadaceae bacterium]